MLSEVSMGKLLDKLRRVQAGGRPFCTMIVPAAGSAARMGGGDKLMMELEGVPVLVRTLRALDAAQLVDEIIIATRERPAAGGGGSLPPLRAAKARARGTGGREPDAVRAGRGV